MPESDMFSFNNVQPNQHEPEPELEPIPAQANSIDNGKGKEQIPFTLNSRPFNSQVVWLSDSQGREIGSVTISFTPQEDLMLDPPVAYDAHIYGVFINPSYRRQGFASVLMAEVVRLYGHLDLSLVVNPYGHPRSYSKKQLKEFYTKFGFVKWFESWMFRHATPNPIAENELFQVEPSLPDLSSDPNPQLFSPESVMDTMSVNDFTEFL